MRELTSMTQERASSWRRCVQVDRELHRATELLKESEDSREALVQEVCLQLCLATFAHRNKPLERIQLPYGCASTCQVEDLRSELMKMRKEKTALQSAHLEASRHVNQSRANNIHGEMGSGRSPWSGNEYMTE